MNKLIIPMMMLLFTLQAAAKEKKKNTNNTPFHYGSKTLGIGLGGGVDYGYYGDIDAIPMLFAVYDQGIKDVLGPGNLGVGGFIGFRSVSSPYLTSYKASWTTVLIGLRTTWHLTLLADQNNKFDPYGGISAGLRISSYKNSYFSSNNLIDPYNFHGTTPIAGLFVGAKYNFSKNFGAFAEVGYDISVLRGGICINF